LGLGLTTISDGMSLYPHRDSKGALWIPQQLWRFRRAPFGVWTVCIHPKDKLYVDFAFFRRRIREYKSSLTSFPVVAAAYAQREHSWTDTTFGELWSLALHSKAKVAALLTRNHETVTTIEVDSGTGLNAAR
jgi:hypothetical protein